MNEHEESAAAIRRWHDARELAARQAVVRGANIHTFYSAEDGGWIAIGALPWISGFGDTPAEAEAELAIATAAAREAYAAEGWHIPRVSLPTQAEPEPAQLEATQACPVCGRSTNDLPISDKSVDVGSSSPPPKPDANIAGEAPPSGWMSRSKLL